MLPEFRWPRDEPYHLHTSTKISALVAIVQHHLSAPGLPALMVQEDGDSNALVVNPDPSAAVDQDPQAGPDRIVVFLAFPKNNWVVHKVRGSFAGDDVVALTH